MKIAFLNLYSGINNRGAESFAHELAGQLAKKNQVDFYSGGNVNIKSVQNIVLNTKIAQPTNSLSFLKLLFLDGAALSVLKFTLKVFPELWGGNYDWIIPMNGFWQVLLCKLIVRSKLLITGHSGPGWDEKWNLWLKPDVFVATTEPTANWAKKISPWTKIVTIPYGIDEYKNVLPVNLDLEKPVILCVAAAVPYKRVDLAIKAVAKLKKGNLLYLGTGPLLPELKALGEKLLGKRFLTLAVGYEQMPSYYQSSDVITLPSSSQENSPMVFLEAMAAGKMTVTTDAPRSRWTLGEAGIFVDPTDTQAYADALQQAIDSKSQDIIHTQAKKYSWGTILGKYEELLN